MARTKKKKASKNCFVLTLPLVCEPWQRDRLQQLFQIGHTIKNYLIAYALVQYQELSKRLDWKYIQARIKEAYKAKEPDEKLLKELYDIRNGILIQAHFTEYDLMARMNRYRKHYCNQHGAAYLNSQVAQKIASNVWKAFFDVMNEHGDKVHFSSWSNFNTLTGKNNQTGIIYRDGTVFLNKMALPVVLDKTDKYGYQIEALKHKILYCGIQRRCYANGYKYYVQLTLEGLPPVKINPETGKPLHPMGIGRVGHDIGTQTVASVGKNQVSLLELANQVRSIDRQLYILNRALDRSRRATNSQFFHANGTLIPKNKLPPELLTQYNQRKWYQSKRYKKLAAQRRELYRRQRELRMQQHYEMANQLLAYGDQHYIERMRFDALAKSCMALQKYNGIPRLKSWEESTL